MSWNIQEGGGGRLDAIAALIGAHKPDCVALLEVDSLRNAEALASELRMALTYGEANCPSAVAWLTTQAPLMAENHRLPQLAKTLLELELNWDGAPLRLFATHLGSRWDTQQPVDEIVTILQVLGQRGGDLHVLAGDLNALRPGDPVGTPPTGEPPRGDAIDGAPRLTIRRILDAGYVDCFRHMHARRPGFTYPSQAPSLRLDYIFASAGLAQYVRSCDVINTRLARHGSDHLPLVAGFDAPQSNLYRSLRALADTSAAPVTRASAQTTVLIQDNHCGLGKSQVNLVSKAPVTATATPSPAPATPGNEARAGRPTDLQLEGKR